LLFNFNCLLKLFPSKVIEGCEAYLKTVEISESAAKKTFYQSED